MSLQRTLSIIKPDAVEKKRSGAILALLEERGFHILAVLEREDAVAEYRNVMGATDPAKAEAGTIRKLHGSNVGENAVHGSDSIENARNEIAYFFAASEVAPTA